MNSLLAPSRENSAVPGADTGEGTISEAGLSCGALLADLETSMRSSQQKLLRGEIEQFEKETDRQATLIRKISACVPPDGNHAAFVRVHLGSAQTVLQLGRVQLALLDRMQQFLKIDRNRAANSAATYDVHLRNAQSVAGRSFSPVEG